MAEYVTKKQVIDWYRPYGQTDEPIPFETLVSDLRDMKTAEVSPVRHGRWWKQDDYSCCSVCGQSIADECVPWFKFCPQCGAKMDLEG